MIKVATKLNCHRVKREYKTVTNWVKQKIAKARQNIREV